MLKWILSYLRGSADEPKVLSDYDRLVRAGLRHTGRNSPVPGIQTADTVSVIGSIFEADAARAAAKWQVTKRNMKRRPPADNWLRQGDGYHRPE